MENLVKKVKEYATSRHNSVNQQYGNEPYSFHLDMVATFARKFQHLIADDKKELVVAGAWAHDLIEDTRVTYNDLGKIFGWELAEIVFCCTEQRGRNRAERHGDDYYKLLSENPLGKFVKLCDICANFSNSKRTGNSMYMKYRKELPRVKEKLYVKGEYEEIWNYLNSL